MIIYLASRYSRRLELCGYRDALRAMGHEVTSRWLDGGHQIDDAGVPIGDGGERLVEGDGGDDSERAAELRERFAREDIEDLVRAEALIAFTEPPRSSASRGGRHVELGIALGRNVAIRQQVCRIAVVGYRENVFCWLPGITFWNGFEALRLHLEAGGSL